MVDATRKSVDFYAFVGDQNLSVTFEKPVKNEDKKTKKKEPYIREPHPFRWKDGLPIQSGGIDISNEDRGVFTNTDCRFSWDASQSRSGQQKNIGSAFWIIDPWNGAMKTGKNAKGSPTDMMEQTSKTNRSENWAYSYGFFDAPAAIMKFAVKDKDNYITNHDQSYVYVTPDVSTWMGDLVRRKPDIGTSPFHRFVLPGSHDAGTYSLMAAEQLSKSREFIKMMTSLLGYSFAKDALIKNVQNFSVTQKDGVATQLDLGARYFDFRPGYVLASFKLSGIYHQHNFIPGVLYDDFLERLLKWLVDHPSEIVVLCLDDSGFADKDAMRPKTADLNAIMTSAKSKAGASTIRIGNKDDFKLSYNDLIGNRTQLILIDRQTRDNGHYASKYDLYDSHESAYQRFECSQILGVLASMNTAGQKGNDYTVMQLQGTATAARVLTGMEAVGKFSYSGSPLVSTKAKFDRQTYPWLVANVRKNLGDGQLIVLLNDFVESALTMHAVKIMEG